MMGLGNGLNDSAPGALIPYMERHYSIGYAIVSLIFVTNAVGFLSAAPLTHLLETRLGRSGAYIVAEALMTAGYIIIICTPPYPLVVASFFLIGLGEAFDLALNNVYCANVGNGTTVLGLLHGGYGVGGTVGPLIATAIASSGIIWSRFYAVAVSLAVLNGVYAGYIFWGYKPDEPSGSSSTSASTAPTPSKTQLLHRAVKSPVTILGAFFIFAYQGAEVSISGWIISFLVAARGGDLSSVGYVTAGFWGGIAVGRFLLSPLAFRVGERVSVVAFTVGCLGFQLIVWFVPNVVGDAVAVAVIGLLLGPVYPCATAVFSRLLPRNLQLTSLGFISSAGSSGGAVWPLATGLIAQQKGTWVLHPICIGLYGVMVGSWILLPKERKRDE
jgi:fucose permease